MKIALLAYNFPHKKTQDFIFRILAEGYQIAVIYAAEPIKLNIPNSTIRTKITHKGLVHPEKIAASLGIRYKVAGHNSIELTSDAQSHSIDLAIIAGARILKPSTIDAFRCGIINFHPGIIPYARGLDAMLWSIYNKLPLGVTAHLIDKHIDAGRILFIEKMKVFHTDTLLDLSERLYELQLDMLPTAIKKAVGSEYYNLTDYGKYNRKMEANMEAEVFLKAGDYIRQMANNESATVV